MDPTKLFVSFRMCKTRPRENLILVEKNNIIQNYIFSDRKITKSWSHEIQNIVEVVGFENDGKPHIIHGNFDKNLIIFHSKEKQKVVKKIFSNMEENFGNFAIFTRIGSFFWILPQSFQSAVYCKLENITKNALLLCSSNID